MFVSLNSLIKLTDFDSLEHKITTEKLPRCCEGFCLEYFQTDSKCRFARRRDDDEQDSRPISKRRHLKESEKIEKRFFHDMPRC
jgi:hypothetical protein